MIPELVGQENPEMTPWAELWMGIHPGGPSLCIDDEQHRTISLPDLIKENSGFYLGNETLKTFGTLPYLFKVLSADKPLSIQAHPNLEQARAGWEKENKAGIDVKAPYRNYKDPNHKPEIICALSPFTAMCGFREPAEIEKLMNAVNCSALTGTLDAIKDRGLKGFLGALFAMSPEDRKILTDHILEHGRELSAGNGEFKTEFDLTVSFAQLYPEDPSIIAPLYLNVIQLNPGEAIYLSAGILHAYVYGLGMELMANSDNVLRGGLTTKYVDVNELKEVLIFKPYKPEIIKPSAADRGSFAYTTECRDFELKYIQNKEGGISYTGKGPSIIFVTSGTLAIKDTVNSRELILKKGESAFLPPAGKSDGIILEGCFEMYAASPGLHQ